MIKLFKSVKTLISIVYIALLIISYAYLIETNPIFLNIKKTKTMDIEMFFYWGLGIFVFISLIFFMFDKVLWSYQTKSKDQNFFTSDPFLTWLTGLNISINVLLCTGVLFIGFLNSESYYKLMDYTILLYVGPILVFISFLWLPFIYFRRN